MNTIDTINTSGKIRKPRGKQNSQSLNVYQRLNSCSGSVLRVAGGKTRAVKKLETFMDNNLTEICSPFFGGGSVELFLAQTRGVRVHAYDIFEPLINFWQCVKESPIKLVEEVKKLHPLSKPSFYNLRDNILGKNQSGNNPPLIRAAAFFAVNRSSFSGTTCSGGFSAESAEKRFTLSSIAKLLKIDLRNIDFHCADFEQSIAQHPPNMFLFLDPPYALPESKAKLYGNSGDLHQHFDHDRLFRILSNRSNWLLCYNNCDAIRKMYSQYTIKEVNWAYGMSTDKKGKELVIQSNNTLSDVTMGQSDMGQT